MKRVFLKDGTYLEAKAYQEFDGRGIAIYEDENLLYSVFSGKSAMNQNIIFREGCTEMTFYEVRQMAEIVENFNQYFNFLNQ